MDDRLAATVAFALLVGCTETHVATGAGRSCELAADGTSDCPAGMYCATVRFSTGERTCRVICDRREGARCEDGTACSHPPIPDDAPEEPYTCWTGGEGAEGDSCLQNLECERGLFCLEDDSSEAIAGTCEPVCNDDGDCRAGEECLGPACGTRCDPRDPTSCAEGTICRLRCVWAPRAADCDGDGTLECPLGQICDFPGTAVTCWDPIEYYDMYRRE